MQDGDLQDGDSEVLGMTMGSGQTVLQTHTQPKSSAVSLQLITLTAVSARILWSVQTFLAASPFSPFLVPSSFEVVFIKQEMKETHDFKVFRFVERTYIKNIHPVSKTGAASSL